MKKIFVISLVFMFSLFSLALIADAQNENAPGVQSGDQGQTGGDNEDGGQGEAVQTWQEIQNQGEETNLVISQQIRERVNNATTLRDVIQERRQEMNQEMATFKSKVAESVYANQNKVRLAVHSLLAMEDLVGGIGSQVSEIAREFDNAVQATIETEEKVKERSRILRFFLGADQEVVQEMEQVVNQNRSRILELKQLKEECGCEEEVKNIFQEQVENMEEEQNRLQQLIEEEKGARGIWGWITGLFGR